MIICNDEVGPFLGAEVYIMTAVWDFRANVELYTPDSLMGWLKSNCKKAVFQIEQGDSGYKHFQGRFSLIKKRQKSPLLNLFKNIPPPNYLEPTVSKEYQKEAFYCMKEDTRIEGPWKFGDEDSDDENEVYIPRQYRDLQLYPWQQKILDDSKIFNPRTINYIYDTTGNNGKSTLASIGELLHGGIDLPPINDYKEVMALMCCICSDKKLRNPSTVFIDMPRALRKDQLYGMYCAIEQIKKGKLYDMRYHYKSWWIDSPAIWVFSNSIPDLSMLSSDRWKIWAIQENELVPFNFVGQKI